jgi:hypothetical protein
MIGTTRSGVSTFMTKFRKLGFIEYNGHLEVHNFLLKCTTIPGSDATKTKSATCLY